MCICVYVCVYMYVWCVNYVCVCLWIHVVSTLSYETGSLSCSLESGTCQDTLAGQQAMRVCLSASPGLDGRGQFYKWVLGIELRLKPVWEALYTLSYAPSPL